MFRTAPVLLVGTLALAACTDPYASPYGDPYYGGQRPVGYSSNAETGAVAGALVGGFLGARSGDNDTLARTAAGAIVGGAIGGAIGTALDRQAADLRRQIGNDQVTVVNTGDRLVVTMPQDILFATDSAVVAPGLRADLAAVAGNLNAYPQSRIEVVGHTDSTGSGSYNLGLSTRRANAVAAVLIDAGVAPARIRTTGAGEDQPVASNLTPEGRAQNRRVEIIIRPTA